MFDYACVQRDYACVQRDRLSEVDNKSHLHVVSLNKTRNDFWLLSLCCPLVFCFLWFHQGQFLAVHINTCCPLSSCSHARYGSVLAPAPYSAYIANDAWLPCWCFPSVFFNDFRFFLGLVGFESYFFCAGRHKIIMKSKVTPFLAKHQYIHRRLQK